MAGDTSVERQRSRRPLIAFRATARHALALVAVFLACHGLFGAVHQLQGPEEGQRVATPQHLLHGDHGSDPAAHLAHADYYAVVVTAILFLGTAIWCLLSGVRARAGQTRPIGTERHSSILALHLPRGPTAPFLQVFRL